MENVFDILIVVASVALLSVAFYFAYATTNGKKPAPARS